MRRFYSALALAVLIGASMGALGHLGFAAVLAPAAAASAPVARQPLDARQRMAMLVAETAARAAAEAAKSVAEEPQLAALETQPAVGSAGSK
jgi:hypothetical protein